jgi:hypothetical protein
VLPMQHLHICIATAPLGPHTESMACLALTRCARGELSQNFGRRSFETKGPMARVSSKARNTSVSAKHGASKA